MAKKPSTAGLKKPATTSNKVKVRFLCNYVNGNIIPGHMKEGDVLEITPQQEQQIRSDASGIIEILPKGA